MVLVSGEGFAPGERVLLYLHLDQIGETKADDAGKFSDVAVTIPASFASFTSQWSVSAEGRGDSGGERSLDERFTITP